MFAYRSSIKIGSLNLDFLSLTSGPKNKLPFAGPPLCNSSQHLDSTLTIWRDSSPLSKIRDIIIYGQIGTFSFDPGSWTFVVPFCC